MSTDIVISEEVIVLADRLLSLLPGVGAVYEVHVARTPGTKSDGATTRLIVEVADKVASDFLEFLVSPRIVWEDDCDDQGNTWPLEPRPETRFELLWSMLTGSDFDEFKNHAFRSISDSSQDRDTIFELFELLADGYLDIVPVSRNWRVGAADLDELLTKQTIQVPIEANAFITAAEASLVFRSSDSFNDFYDL